MYCGLCTQYCIMCTVYCELCTVYSVKNVYCIMNCVPCTLSRYTKLLYRRKGWWMAASSPTQLKHTQLFQRSRESWKAARSPTDTTSQVPVKQGVLKGCKLPNSTAREVAGRAAGREQAERRWTEVPYTP